MAAAVKAEPGGAVKADTTGQQQLPQVKQEVKQEPHLSRNNSELTLGISADQEANVGSGCTSSWFLRTACGCCNAQSAVCLAVALRMGMFVCLGVAGSATDYSVAIQRLAALLPVMLPCQMHLACFTSAITCCTCRV